MAGEPKKRPNLVSVDENYTPPENATPGEALKGEAAALKRASIAEGVRRQKAKQDAETQLVVQGVKSAHVDELNRSGKIVARAAHRDGVLQGVVMGMALAVALAFATWFVLREVVITNTATQRVNYPNPPELTVPDSTSRYERNRREPADAQQ